MDMKKVCSQYEEATNIFLDIVGSLAIEQLDLSKICQLKIRWLFSRLFVKHRWMFLREYRNQILKAMEFTPNLENTL